MGEFGQHGHHAGSNATVEAAPDRSFLDMVRQTVNEKANDVFATWYGSHGEAKSEYTFGELWEEAGRISYYLRIEWDLKKGDRVVLCYNFGLHFFAVFLGCIRAGVVAVLVYPPIPPLSQSLPKMNKVIVDCDARLILIDSDIALLRTTDKWNPFSKTRQEWPDDNRLRITNKLARSPQGQKPLEFDAMTSLDDLAFFQYTSGSTGDPKGVMVTFGALGANVRLILNLCYGGAERGGIAVPSEIRGFSWLPQYHDMGLIHGTIAPFAAGWRMHMMSPIDFIRNPLLWLDLMSRHNVHWGVAPDFAYSLAARKFIEAKQRNNGIEPIPCLNLSSLLFLNNAAEPVRTNTVETFGKVFTEYGLRKEWLVVSYGLAEHVVGVCSYHGYHLSDPRDEDKYPLVACGLRDTFEQDMVVKIVDPETLKEVDDRATGELWLSGPCVAAGYFKKPQLTEEVFHAKMIGSERKFLRTGDLAFFQDDKLFICGRIKDLIIINGVNYYPQDIEYAVQGASPAVRPGCVAAFSAGDGSNGVEVVFEIRNARLKDADRVIQAVRRSVSQRIGLLPSRIVAIKERTIPKTTSGKIRRTCTRTSLCAGKLVVVSEDRKVAVDYARTGVHPNQGMEEKERTDPEKKCPTIIISTKHFALMDCEGIDELLGYSDAATGASILDSWEKTPVSPNECAKANEKESLSMSNKQADIVNAEDIDLVRRTFASMLGVPPDEISLDRPLTEIGLTSMMAVELSDVLSRSTGRDFPVSFLYGDSTTLETVAGFLEGLEEFDLRTSMSNWIATEKNAPNRTSLRQSERFRQRLASCGMKDVSISESTLLYPLTRVQQRMLLLQHMDPELGVYNITINVKLLKDVGIQQLEVLFRALMKLHPVLCTRYLGDASSPEPTIGLVDLTLADEFVVTVLDESALTDAKVSRIVQESFDLQAEASLRVYYVPHTQDLVMVFPHIAFDGGSAWGLVSHLSELYMDPDWMPPNDGGLDYIDYAWREFEKEEKGVSYDVSFWTDHLGLNEGSLPVLELPDDPDRLQDAPSTQAVIASVEWTDSCLHESVLEMSRQQSVTPFVVYMCMFEFVVKFFAGQNDLLLGIPMNLRPRSHSHALGMFVNTIALRLRDYTRDNKEERREQDEESLSDFLQRRAMLWESSLKHGDVPFDIVSSQVRGREGVFRALFNYMIDLDIDDRISRRPSALFTKGSVRNELLCSMSKFDLEFSVNKSGMIVLAREQIWSRTMLQRFLDCYVKLLTDVTSKNYSLDAPCSKLELLPDGQAILLNNVLTGHREIWADQLLMHEFFEKTVNGSPNCVALRMMEKTMSYQHVEDRANQLAHLLLEHCGVKVEDRVGILLPRGFEQIIALLGILKAGCAYVPLDDTYPESRIAAIIEDCRMVACITTEHNGLCGHVRNCISLTIEDKRLNEMSTTRPTEVAVTRDNLCYVLYTSGSTGTPKGVEIEHRSVCNLGLNLLSDYPRFDCREDNFLLTSRLSWDASVECIVFSFGSGGTLCLVPPVLSGNLALNLNMLVSEMNVTRLLFAPAFLHYLHLEKQKSLRHVIVGGDVVTPQSLKPFVEHGLYVTHEYGPSEATVTVTRLLVTDSGRSMGIGGPISNVRLYVLDRHMNQVPVGVIGELYIGGVCLARGYTNREATKASFVDSPFVEQCSLELPDEVGSRRLYRTGDLVRVLPDGSLGFVGRINCGSSYIKLRGYRIELNEICAVLETHGAVDHAVVMVDEPRQQLVAFVSPRLVEESELVELCRSKLVDYAVPAKIMVLDCMPVDANGKINRKALLDIVKGTLVQDEVVRPANEVEEMLAAVLGQVLNLPEETVSVTANLFDVYGANSLTLAQFVSEIRRKGNVGELSMRDMSMRDVFLEPTLRQLSSMIIDKSTRVGPDLRDEVCKEATHLQDLQVRQAPDLPAEMLSFAKRPTVLVTGATGYLGSHVLHCLLKTKGMNIMVLVRAKNETVALERVTAALASNELLSRRVATEIRGRCKMICGDLSLPNLGLEESRFLQVGTQISAIVHCGAKVHHLASYDSLKPTNVNGTKEILRLSAATDSPIKTTVLHMSTTSIFGERTNDGVINVLEDNDALDEHDKLISGYAQSKWVAEQLCRRAQKQGWPVCILRVGSLLPRMGHQVWQEQSTASAMLASCRMLGVLPADVSFSGTAVDFAARATVHILRHSTGNHPERVWTTFHLCDPPSSLVGASTAHRWLCLRGRRARKVPFKEYVALLAEKAMSCSDPTVAANLTNLEQLISHHRSNLIFDNSRLAGILKGSRIKLPRMTLRRFLTLYDSSRLFVEGAAVGRSEVAQLPTGADNKLSRANSTSLFAGKHAKRDTHAEHVVKSVKDDAVNLFRDASRKGMLSAVSDISSGDTGSGETTSDEMADTKPTRNRVLTARIATVLGRRKKGAGIHEELASLKSDMKKLMSMVDQIASRQAKNDN